MEQSLAYWKNIEETEREVKHIKGDYLINIYMVNMYTCDEYFKWVPCRDAERLLGYIKYIALPSLSICRKLVNSNDEYCDLIIYGVFDYKDAVEIIGNIDGEKEYLDDYIEWFDTFDKMDENTSFETIREEVAKIAHKVDEEDFKRGFLFNMEVYEDIEDVKKRNIDDFEEL